MTIHTAEAARFGGGRSFGVQRSHGSLFSRPAYQKQQPFKQSTPTKKWGGVLGGLLVGGLLASLFMGHGLGSGLLAWLIIGAGLFLIINVLRKRMQPFFQTPNANSQAFRTMHETYQNGTASNSSAANSQRFSSENFLRTAKVMFIRLQTAYDQKNEYDLKTFTAPDVFAEIKMQLDERNNDVNTTEVIHLDAELLDMSKQAIGIIASVHFTGSLKENNTITALDEIWHFRQLEPNTEWHVAGIQQECIKPH